MATIVNCKECKEEKEITYGDPDKLVALQLCSTCNHWHEAEVLKDAPESVRVHGIQYFIGREDCPRKAKGFGGSLYEIKFADGRKVQTTNLNYIGIVPGHFKSRLPDNAEFDK